MCAQKLIKNKTTKSNPREKSFPSDADLVSKHMRKSKKKIGAKALLKKNLKLNLIKQFQKLRIHTSDDTEDGVETESDFFLSSSFSETGEDADIEEDHDKVDKSRVRIKSSNSRNSIVSSEDDLPMKSPPYDEIDNGLPKHCQEGTLEESCIILGDFRGHSPFKRERFEDKGILADVEDCEDSEKSDQEYEWKFRTWRYIYRAWNNDY